MKAAIAEAREAASVGEVPVGAVVYRDGTVVARAHNESVARRDPTAHAELLAVQRALDQLQTDRLNDCTLYVTLEPCAQCAGAIVLAKVGRVVFGAYDPKAGMAGSLGDLLSPPLEPSGRGGGWSRGRRVWRGPAGVLPRPALAPLERPDQASQGLHRHIELLVGQVGGGPQAQHVPAVVGQHAALSEPAAELARVG